MNQWVDSFDFFQTIFDRLISFIHCWFSSKKATFQIFIDIVKFHSFTLSQRSHSLILASKSAFPDCTVAFSCAISSASIFAFLHKLEIQIHLPPPPHTHLISMSIQYEVNQSKRGCKNLKTTLLPSARTTQNGENDMVYDVIYLYITFIYAIYRVVFTVLHCFYTCLS